MTVWIERHDLSRENLEDPSMDSFVSTLQTVDWQAEARLEEEAKRLGKDCCPAGMGIIHSGGQILHIIPGDESNFRCHYHFPVRQRKILGIFGATTRMETLSFEHLEKKDLLAVIQAHYRGNHATVMNRLAQTATRI